MSKSDGWLPAFSRIVHHPELKTWKYSASRSTTKRMNRPAKLPRPVCLLAVLLLGACTGLLPTPDPTLTPAPTGTSTPTTVWFPPTNTPTSQPSPTSMPTRDSNPGVGELIFADSFDQPELWSTSSSSYATASVDHGRLILSINGSGPLSILSLRSEPVLRDFYAEATIHVSLCRGQDQYGMVFRASPGNNFYRLSVNCDGQVRLGRGRTGSVSALVDWLPSGDAPRGAPADLKIGIWAVGSEMRFFLNDRLQFSFRDPILHEGTLGFYAYADGTTPVAVSFSDLAAYTVFYVSPTPSPFPTSTPRP
jgi:hypothetical protein